MTTIRKSETTGGWFPRKRRQRREALQSSLSTSPTAKIPAAKAGMLSNGTKKLAKPQSRGNSSITPSSNNRLKKHPTHATIDVSVMPLWLTRLCICQRNTSVATFIFVGLTLLVYGWNVYSQQLWGKSFEKLQNLQRQERQLTATNGVLKNKMATDAEKNNNGLTSITPEGMIFLAPTPSSATPTPHPTPQTLPPNSVVQPPDSTSPGY
jgi:hypothetical protein